MGSPAVHLQNWQSMCQSSLAFSVVESGFRLPWVGRKPPLLPSPPPLPQRWVPVAKEALANKIFALLSIGTVEQVLPDSPGFCGCIFIPPRASGEWRPVLNLSTLNRFLKHIRFKMETPLSIRATIRPGHWATPIDLKEAYFHVLIHRRDRK